VPANDVFGKSLKIRKRGWIGFSEDDEKRWAAEPRFVSHPSRVPSAGISNVIPNQQSREAAWGSQNDGKGAAATWQKCNLAGRLLSLTSAANRGSFDRCGFKTIWTALAFRVRLLEFRYQSEAFPTACRNAPGGRPVSRRKCLVKAL